METSTWVGWDPREADAFAVARLTAQENGGGLPRGLVLDRLRARGLYWREHSRKDGILFDGISQAPMSTEFAISRFLVPFVAAPGLALFMDCDMLVRGDLNRLFASVDPAKAVSVVKHRQYYPEEGGPAEHGTKMDGQVQTSYPRKNWSSVMVFNVGHPANDRLTVDMVNTLPGRDLHRFCWLEDSEIGQLDPEWNYLLGVNPIQANPGIVHFTLGIPSMEGYENSDYADDWRAALGRWAADG